MISNTIILSALIALTEASFGNEQVPIPAISALQAGAPGAAATIAGAAISDLLGGANPCDKLVRADQIVTELGDSEDVILAAIGLVTAQKNTNPFVNDNLQVVCADPTLPATEALRGITTLIDENIDTKGKAKLASEESAASPLDATDKSVFDLMVEKGLGALIGGVDADGNVVEAAAGADAGAGAGDAAEEEEADAGEDIDEGVADEEEAAACEVAGGNNNATAGAADDQAADEEDQAADDNQQADDNNQDQNQNDNANDNANNQDDAAAGGAGGADFGLCQPGIIFEGGQGGRPADEFTFQIEDPLARGGQQEALNPKIITNAFCDALVNVCEANQAALDACDAADAAVDAAQRNQATADAFNDALLAAQGGAKVKRTMRRGLRA